MRPVAAAFQPAHKPWLPARRKGCGQGCEGLGISTHGPASGDGKDAIQRWSLEMKKDEGQAVAYSDIRGYVPRSVVCPAGGTCFEDSYTLTTVEAAPICQRKTATHKLPP